jgi:hypothetical protein
VRPEPAGPFRKLRFEIKKEIQMSTFTLVHVGLSLVGIVSGFVVVFGLIAGKRLAGWTPVFLATTVLTSVTGFFFPFHRLLPSHIVGIVSLVVLAVALFALYVRRLTGPWRRLYAISAVLALYLNFFVLIVQLFRKVPALKVLAPTQSEPPFQITQLITFVLFAVLTVFAAIKFRARPSAGESTNTAPLRAA